MATYLPVPLCPLRLLTSGFRSAKQYEQEQRRVIVEEACALFEESGKRGIAHLKNKGYFPAGGTSEEIAEFLFTQSQKDLST